MVLRFRLLLKQTTYEDVVLNVMPKVMILYVYSLFVFCPCPLHFLSTVYKKTSAMSITFSSYV